MTSRIGKVEGRISKLEGEVYHRSKSQKQKT